MIVNIFVTRILLHSVFTHMDSSTMELKPVHFTNVIASNVPFIPSL